jgi:hypothetical protein
MDHLATRYPTLANSILTWSAPGSNKASYGLIAIDTWDTPCLVVKDSLVGNEEEALKYLASSKVIG